LKPVIAAVHGYCIGGGIDLITACDIRLAAADAVLSVRETKIAIVADVGTLQRLPGIVGEGHVAELVYTGKDIRPDYAPRTRIDAGAARRSRAAVKTLPPPRGAGRIRDGTGMGGAARKTAAGKLR